MSGLSHVRTIPIPSHGIVLCVHHKYCLLPDRVHKHLSTLHADHTTPEERMAIQAHINSLRDQLHQTFSDIQIPRDPCPVIEGLEVHSDSLKCNACSYICAGDRRRDNMKGHLRSAHGIGARLDDSAAHGNREAFWSSHWRSVTSQRLFTSTKTTPPNGGRGPASHFEVYQVSEDESSQGESSSLADINCSTPDPAGADSTVLGVIDTLQAQFDEAEVEALEEQKMAQAVVPFGGDRQTNPYLEHTKFQACIEGMEWEDVHRYTAPASTPALVYLEATVKSMAMVYQHTVAATSRWARIRVMQEHRHHVPLAPLFHYQSYDLRHSLTLVKVFTFFFHVYITGLPRPSTLHTNARQERAWGAIQQHLEHCEGKFPRVDPKHRRRQLSHLEGLCHQFWLSLLEQTNVSSDFSLALTTPLAFVAVDPNDQKFRAAYLFATDLAAIKKFARFAGCQKLWEDFVPEAEVERDTNEGQSRESPPDSTTQPDEVAMLMAEPLDIPPDEETKHRGVNDGFRDWICQYLTTEYSTPMSWAITTSHYISKFRYGETLDAFVRWNGPTVNVRHISTTFDKYTAMVWSIHHRLESLLLQLTFTEKISDLPAIPWRGFQDDTGNEKPYYSPFSPRESTLSHMRHFVQRQMMEAIRRGKHKGLTISDLSDYNGIKRYGNLVAEFLDLLFIELYCSSGLPGRLPELASLRHENTVSDGIRNLFAFDGHVAMVPWYHKGYNRDKSLKIIYRFPPREAGSLLVWYLSLVRPFLALLTQRQREGLRTPHYYRARSPFVWSDASGEQLKDCTRLANVMRRTTEQYLGQAIGPGIMRHLLIAFGRKMDDGRNGPLQALSTEEAEDLAEDAEADAREVQAGHTAATAKAIYALETVNAFRARGMAPETYLKASTRWHASMGFEMVEGESKAGEQHTAGSSMAMERIMARQGTISASHLLRENMGKGSRFRGQQRQVVEHIIDGEPVVAYIAGTGSGKSLSFLLPACCPEFGQQIVVTPLIALRIDIGERCGALSITRSEFGQSTFDETARIILASPGDIARKEFVQMVNRRRDRGLLERIVLDEFHYVLLRDHEYRTALLGLREMGSFGMPVTLLSASVPFEREQDAYRLLGLRGCVKAFREPTSRANLRYEVDEMDQKRAVTVADMAAYLRRQEGRHSKILVYVAHVTTAQKLSEALGCYCYHGRLSEDERRRLQRDFGRCPNGILIATVSFIGGIDIADIRLVLWFGEPDEPISWLQGAGRGGRDGLPCVVRIVLGPGIASYFDKLEDAAARAVIDQTIQRKRCIRIPIGAYFDGDRKRLGCRPGEEPCIVCSPKSRETLDPLTTPTRPTAAKDPKASASSLRGGSAAREEIIPSSPPSWPRTVSAARSLASGSPSCARAESTPSLLTSPFDRTALDVDSPSTISSGSPSKRHRHQLSSSNADNAASAESSRTRVKAARVQRAVDFNKDAWLERGREGATVVYEELNATGKKWVENCARCFADGSPFDHPKSTCSSFTGELVRQYRTNRMSNKFGSPQCYFCLMPQALCSRWLDAQSGRVLARPAGSSCSYPNAILDTWACLWEYCPKAKAVWLARIREETSWALDGEREQDFVTYFREMRHYGNGKSVGRIALDVSWFTHRYFTGDGERWKELL